MTRDGLQGFFKKDIATLCILALLDGGEELYGYELMQRMDVYSEGRFVLPEGTLYPILYRLEEQGYVASEKRLVGKRMQRVYYRLTVSGKAFFRQMADVYTSVTAGAQGILSRSHGEEAQV